MLLWQQGRLDLDSPVQKYCRAFPQKGAIITVRELLGHLGGIRHYRSTSHDDPEFGNTKHCSNPIQDGLNFFKNDPLVAKPGTEFVYSSDEFNLVGCAIEGASEENYVDYVQRNVLLPAGMNQTVVDDRFSIITNRTRFYDKDKSGTGGKETYSALGWDLGKNLGVRYIGHGGEEQGTSTFLLFLGHPDYPAISGSTTPRIFPSSGPDRPTAVVVLMNLHHGDAYALAATLMKLVNLSKTAVKRGHYLLPFLRPTKLYTPITLFARQGADNGWQKSRDACTVETKDSAHPSF